MSFGARWLTGGWEIDSANYMAWADGYTVDTPYVAAFASQSSPAWLSAISVLGGQPPIDFENELVWLDVGCGPGLGSCIVAAANPNVHVWGVDYNPAHIERARGLARKANLSNCTFVESSFQSFSTYPAGLEQVDVIVVNGVYSWVSAENQAHIRTIIERLLVPGGLVSLMYESPTGWASMVPIAELLRLVAVADGRPGHLAFEGAADAVRRLRDGGARCFPLGQPEATQMESWGDADSRYAAHEYFGSHFNPLMADQVAPLMAEARCTYLGSDSFTDHVPGFWATPNIVDLLGDDSDVMLRELVRDLAVERPLRRDVYRRGFQHVTSAQQRSWLQKLRIAGLGIMFKDEPVTLLAGEVSLDRSRYEPLLDHLVFEPLGIESIMEIHPDWNLGDAVTALSILVTAGYATPAIHGEVDRRAKAASARLNSVLIAENRLGMDNSVLAAPALGSGLCVDALEALVIGMLWENAAIDPAAAAAMVLADLGRQGRFVREEGKLVVDEAAALGILRRRAESAVEKVAGILPLLGIEGP